MSRDFCLPQIKRSAWSRLARYDMMTVHGLSPVSLDYSTCLIPPPCNSCQHRLAKQSRFRMTRSQSSPDLITITLRDLDQELLQLMIQVKLCI